MEILMEDTRLENIETTLTTIQDAIKELPALIENVKRIVKLLDDNGQPGLVSTVITQKEIVRQLSVKVDDAIMERKSDFKGLSSLVESVKTKMDKVSLVGCRLGQTGYHDPKSNTRRSDSVTFKWVVEKVVVPWAPWGAMIAVIVKLFFTK
jgi:hypothetical protein